MRAFFLTGTSLAFACVVATGATGATVAACATAEDAAPEPNPDADSSSVPDSGTISPQDASDGEASAPIPPGPLCSAAGWCDTVLPDVDLSLKDIWPVAGRAFAVAESATRGVKVLEWTKSDGKWSYIDDGTQNQLGLGNYAGNVFAPNENEVYYTVAPRTVYHGKRNDPQASQPWSWTHQQLENRLPTHAPPAFGAPEHYLGRPMDPASYVVRVSLGVFGTSTGDVYAWFGNTIYHSKNDDEGAPTWSVDYVADDRDNDDELLVFLGATGTGGDDVWFVGGRGGAPYVSGSCAIAVHKTATGYHRVLDGVADRAGCTARPDAPETQVLAGAAGWLSEVRTISANRVVGFKGANELVRITGENESCSTESSTVPFLSNPFISPYYLTFSVGPGEPVWLGGKSLLVQGLLENDAGADGGSYAISTLSLNGSAINTPVYRIRSSSSNDVWLVGDYHALHKTTP